ncbi:MAG: cell division protein FtsQ/DivIB [Sphingomonadales bacterium]|jgi:cell division protein FtsQ
MKIWLIRILWTLVSVGTIVVFYFAQKTDANRILDTPKVAIHAEDENTFLTKQELLYRLQLKQLLRKDMPVKALQVQRIEQAIAAMPEVKHVNVYRHLGAKLEIDLTLRKPIARVFNTKGQSYYLDQEGFMMYRSALHTARVLVFSGAIDEPYNPRIHCGFINNGTLKSSRKIDQIYHISNYVCNDPLMHRLIGQVFLDSSGDFILIPLLGDQQIIFGAARSDKEVADKFERLKHFYKEALPHEGWNKYKEISVKYEGQIVCRKK